MSTKRRTFITGLASLLVTPLPAVSKVNGNAVLPKSPPVGSKVVVSERGYSTVWVHYDEPGLFKPIDHIP